MKVFIGSSREAYDDLREIASWVEEVGLEPLAWDDPALFLPGENTLLRLIEIAKEVDGAIFVFGEDDEVWYRADTLKQPRDNVLIEYGLFTGMLGPKRTIICRKGDPKTAVNLLGITYIDLDPKKKQGARLKLLAWARTLGKQMDDPTLSQLLLQREILRREREELNERLSFEQQKAHDLEQLLKQTGHIDFSKYDFNTDGHWKLLFDYDYFWGVVYILIERFVSERQWIDYLEQHHIHHGVHLYEYQLRRGIAKTLRYFRFYNDRDTYARLLGSLDSTTQGKIQNLADHRVADVKSSRAADQTE